jgi:hypothetical protein
LYLVLVPGTGQTETVPLPQAKPNAAEREPDDARSRACLAGLRETGVVGVLAPVVTRDDCAIEEPVAVEAVDTRTGRVALPARLILDCRFAAVLGTWLSEVVSPVAASLLGSPVEEVVTGPGYQCRRRSDAKLSQHALGKAVDISGFRLADGRNIPVARLAEAEGAELMFLMAVSTSACGYFTTVLGPGSDPAHVQHLHIDLAERSMAEFRICMPR